MYYNFLASQMEYDKVTVETNEDTMDGTGPCKLCFHNSDLISKLEKTQKEKDDLAKVKVKVLSDKIFKLQDQNAEL